MTVTLQKMFPDDANCKRQFVEMTRYNAPRSGRRLRDLSRRAGAVPANPVNHESHPLSLNEDMTNSADAQNPAPSSSGLILSWRRIAQQLCPIIGESGFCALFGRAVHVVGPEHAWLAPQQSCRSPEQLFGLLEERMALVDAGRAAAANDTLLRTFTQLLATLIGETLTGRVLSSAMAAADPQASVQEQK